MIKKATLAFALSITTLLSFQSVRADRVDCPQPTEIQLKDDTTGYYTHKYYADTKGAMKARLTHDSTSRIIWNNRKIYAKTNVYGFEGKLVCMYVDPYSTNPPEYSPSLYSEQAYPTCKASADGTYFDCPKEAIGQVKK